MIQDLKKNLPLIYRFMEIVYFIFIYILSVIPSVDFDVWFHLKSGEIIANQGIIHHDVFSYNTAGREWFPYEWLFQVFIYYFHVIFGFNSLKFLMALIITLMVFALYSIFKQIFKVNIFLSFIIALFYLASIFEFLTVRPHVLANTFLITNLFFIFLYFFNNKNLLWATVPITLVWANMHGSIFLDVALFLGYTIIAGGYFILTKKQEWLNKAKTLGIFTLITIVLTVLPPLGILQYRLLFWFFQERHFLSSFIDEWTPLTSNPFSFIYYSISVAIVFVLLIVTIIIKRNWKNALWIIPLLPFPLMAYSASRNVFLGYITMSLILGWIASFIHWKELKLWGKLTLVSICIIVIAFHTWVFQLKKIVPRLYFPIEATQFIKDYDLKGHMFNEYAYGGYLLYNLYPEQKVFFDGRTDIYLCCEMRDILDLAFKKNTPDKEYKKFLDGMWNKYDISFVLMRTEKHSTLRKIARILSDDLNWNLVYWDDNSHIFVRRDGKNDHVLKQFETKSSTPYNRDPFRNGQDTQALQEYLRMIKISDSAKSRNTIGYIYLKQKKFEEAREQFEKAIQLDPLSESAYMNLAELEAKDGNIVNAINLYQKAQKLAPDRGLIYIRLGQLTLDYTGDRNKALKIWQFGLTETVDTASKKQLQNLVSDLLL